MKLKIFLLALILTHSKVNYGSVQDIADYTYQAINTVIKKYERSWTFCELWADESTVAFHLASRHKKAVCLLVSDAADLIKQCNQHAQLKNVIALNKTLNEELLTHFGDCEHIDCTFAHDLTPHLIDWKKGIDAILNFGDFVIMQAPPLSSSKRKVVEEYMLAKDGILLATPPDQLKNATGSLYFFSPHKKILLKRYWQYHKIITPGEYTIKSTFKEKKLIKNKIRPKEYAVTEWLPGINLFTFRKMNGIWPAQEAIIKIVLQMTNIKHNDFRISNLIIQGSKIIPIDGDSKGHENTVADFMPHLLEQLSR